MKHMAFAPAFRGEDSGGDSTARAALARLVQLAPAVWPGVAVEADWNAALATARVVLRKKETGT